MKTAILIDGAFFIKRIRTFESENYFEAQRMAELVTRYALLHLRHKINDTNYIDDLYRIFFCDCVPFEKKMHNPISGKVIDFSKTPEAVFCRQLHECFKWKRKLTLRLGKLLEHANWIKNPATKLSEEDIMLYAKQKGVDMRMIYYLAGLRRIR